MIYPSLAAISDIVLQVVTFRYNFVLSAVSIIPQRNQAFKVDYWCLIGYLVGGYPADYLVDKISGSETFFLVRSLLGV